MVVEKNQNRSILLATYWNLAQNSGDLEIYFLKSGKFCHFFHGKSFVLVKIIFFRSKFGKISKKKTLHLRCLLSSWTQLCRSLWVCYWSKHLKWAALKVRVPGSASTLCRPLIHITEPPSGFTPCPPHKALPDFL